MFSPKIWKSCCFSLQLHSLLLWHYYGQSIFKYIPFQCFNICIFIHIFQKHLVILHVDPLVLVQRAFNFKTNSRINYASIGKFGKRFRKTGEFFDIQGVRRKMEFSQLRKTFGKFDWNIKSYRTNMQNFKSFWNAI